MTTDVATLKCMKYCTVVDRSKKQTVLHTKFAVRHKTEENDRLHIYSAHFFMYGMDD